VRLFESAGHEVEVQPLLDDGYLGELYKTGRRGWRWLATGYGRRLLNALRVRRFDAVICEQEVCPFLPAFIELFFQRLSSRFFVDYDDAPYANYSRWPIFGERFHKLWPLPRQSWLATINLAGYARQFARRVCVIPTVVDLPRYPNQRRVDASEDHSGGMDRTPPLLSI